MDRHPHIGLIKIEYSVHECLLNNHLNPESVDKSKELIIIGILGQDKDVCIRKVREAVQELKDVSAKSYIQTSQTTD